MTSLTSDHSKRSDYRTLIVIAIYGLVALGSVVNTVSVRGLPSYTCSVLIAAMMASWCVSDSYFRAAPLLPVVQLIIFLTWPIGVPIYLIATRKWRGLFYTIAHIVGLLLVTVVASAIAQYFI